MNKAPSFDEFWTAYPVRRNRRRTEPVWNRLTAKEKRAAMAGIAAYRAALPPGIAMAYPHNYLRDHRWEDEAEAPLSSVAGAASIVPAAVPVTSPTGRTVTKTEQPAAVPVTSPTGRTVTKTEQPAAVPSDPLAGMEMW